MSLYRGLEIPTRTPGAYRDDGISHEPLHNPNELIHPSVRIRYQYGGKDLDDIGEWRCRPLVNQNYGLQKAEAIPPRDFRTPGHYIEYKTTGATVQAHYDDMVERKDVGNILVKIEQPSEVDDLHTLAEPVKSWLWVNKQDGKSFPEEQIGIWERMFIKANEKLIEFQKREKDLSIKGQEQSKARANRWAITIWASSALEKTRSSLAMTWNTAINIIPHILANAPMEKVTDPDFPTHGYHNIVSWQRADPASRSNGRKVTRA
jgi:hypothetical protein